MRPVEAFLASLGVSYQKVLEGESLALWSVDLSPLFRRFDTVPFIEILQPSPEINVYAFPGALRYFKAEIAVAILPPGGARLSRTGSNWVIINHATFVEMTTANVRPRIAFMQHLHAFLPLGRLSPYQTNLVAKDRMFFGREEEITSVIRRSTENVAIFGPRRVGKSSLAREVERRLIGERGQGVHLSGDTYLKPVAFVDCNLMTNLADCEDAFFQAALDGMGLQARDLVLNKKLFGTRQKSLSPFEFFTKLVQVKRLGVRLIIDEIDGLLEKQAPQSWPLMRKVQGLVDQLYRESSGGKGGSVTVILVGFTTLHDSMYDNKFPFYGRLRPLALSNLGRDATAKLINEPLRELGVTVGQEKDIVNRVVHYTGGMPSVVQSLCLEAISQLEQDETQNLTPEIVDRVIETRAPLNDYINWFDFSGSREERFIVYSCSQHGRFSMEVIRAALEAQSFAVSQEQLRRSLDHLTLANILKANERHKSYEFSMEAFRLVIEQRIHEQGGRAKVLKEIIRR